MVEDFTEEALDVTLASVMTTVVVLISFLFREEAILKLRTNLRMHLRRFMGLGLISKQFMKERSIHAGNASTRQLQNILVITEPQDIKRGSGKSQRSTLETYVRPVHFQGQTRSEKFRW